MPAYFYDSQCRRFLTQFGLIFSDFSVEFGKDPLGNSILKTVPVMYGDMSRQAAAVLSNNSPSNLLSAPMMTYYVSGFEYDQRRTQDPYFLDKVVLRQRTLNQETGEYETTQGNAFDVERIMPVPYTLRVTLDIWTTSSQQKFEILEQLGVLFNPSMEVQSTDNFIDWTSLSVIYQDGITWSSRSIPLGSGNPMEITSWKFYMPIWISSPIKVKKMKIIQRIIANIYKGSALEDLSGDPIALGTREIITPYGYQLLLVGNKLQILPSNQPADNPLDPNTTIPNPTTGPNTSVYWHSVLNVYGVVRPGVSQIYIENEWMTGEIVGTIDYDPLDDRLLTYTIDVDTLPSNTLSAVDSIIDPNAKWPDNGLPAAIVGQRYLIVTDLAYQREYSSVDLTNWPGLTSGASANDIIELGTIVTVTSTSGSATVGSTTLVLANINGIAAGYTVTLTSTSVSLGTVMSVDYLNNQVTLDTPLASNIANGVGVQFIGIGWKIVFNSASTTVQFVTNTTTGIQYRFNEGVWRKSWEGYYDQGAWRVAL